MKIEKKGKTFNVKENKASWTIKTSSERLTVTYNIQKVEYPTFDDVKAFVMENDLV